MSAQALLDRLAKLGITVDLDGDDRLAIEGSDQWVGAEIETIRQNKPAIIAHLKAQRLETASAIRQTPAPAPTPAAPPAPVAAATAPPPQSKPLGKIEPRARRATASRRRDTDRRPLGARLAAPLAGVGRTATTIARGAAGRLAATWANARIPSLSGLASVAKPVEETPRVHSSALPFQSDLVAIIEEPPPTHMRMTTYLLAGMVSLAVLIAAVVEIDIVIRGTGKLTVDGPPLVLQPIERSILRALHVKPGDTVTKGQVLATLDPTFAEADATAIEAQQRMVAAQLRRLEAESREEPFLPESNSTEETLQSEIYRQRRQEFASRVKAFDDEIKRAQAAVRTLEFERTMLEQQLVVARDVEQMRTTLFASQSGSRLQFLESRSVRIRAERDHQGANDRLIELDHNLDAKRAERQAFIDEWRRRLFEEVERLRGEAARVEGAQAKARRYKELVVISAPQDGVVIDIAKRSVGSILKEAETLIMLAPSHMPLIAEVSLASADVGYAKAGDTVVVKVDTFPYTRHGTLKGRLRSIS
ncbi:MAG: HlyD family type I secretion periplasmic adaptor subunit [Hyphomicrobiaceae bacterium]